MGLFLRAVLATALLLPVPAQAARIFDMQPSEGQLVYDGNADIVKSLARGGAFTNGAGSNRAYLFNEGSNGDGSSFILVLDADRARLTNTGSFKIKLESWERLIGISTSAAALQASDPANGWTYTATSRGLEGSDSFSAAELKGIVTVNYSLKANNAYDSARIQIAADSSRMQIAAVPEPATWAMFFLGFGLVGFSMRRRMSASHRNDFA